MRENEKTSVSVDEKAKEQFEQAVIEIIVFTLDDIITTSGDEPLLPKDQF